MDGIHFIRDLAVILMVAGAVGWVCKRAGLSVVAGFLLAGIVVGPHTQVFAIVVERANVEALAEMGLVFLMFAIGMRLSLRRLRRLGLSLVVATCGAAVGVYYLARVLGAGLDWSGTQTLFLAAMLMVSSSAIISKLLQEAAVTHERFGQVALGITVLEDVVAVVMLTLLNSIVQIGEASEAGVAPVWETVGMLVAFVVLAGVSGLLLVPWLLRRMSVVAAEELQTLGIAALLFGLAFVAQRAGYSLALGAFLLGTIVAETAHRHQVERTFEGMRDVFTAVFFVAIGMQIEPRALWENAGVIAGVSAFALVVRPLASALALTLIGTPVRDGLRAGLCVTPIGEFSFIIAQLGVSAAVLPEKFYPLAVGVSLITTLMGPVLVKRSEGIAEFVEARLPRWLMDWVRYYQGRLERLTARQRRSRLWQLSRKRFIQIGVEVALVSGVLVISGQILNALERRVGSDWLFPGGPEVMFWVALGVVLIAPLVAIWRNISALSLMFSQAATAGLRRGRKAAPTVEAALKAVAGVLLFLWLVALLPLEGTARLFLLASAVVAVGAILVLRQRLIYWHSHLEAELQTVMNSAESKMTDSSAPWLQRHEDWNVRILDCVLPDLADARGKTIAELNLRATTGCAIVGIDRQGYMIALPAAETVLYPRDRVLLMGTAEQVQMAKRLLLKVADVTVLESVFEEVQMQSIQVPRWSQAVGKAMSAIAPAATFGVQIAGLNRRGKRMLNPSAEETLQADDEVLVLGTPEQTNEFRVWLREKAEEAEADDEEI
jgi:Kef-type K+ transport systems, membrane components